MLYTKKIFGYTHRCLQRNSPKTSGQLATTLLPSCSAFFFLHKLLYFSFFPIPTEEGV